MRGVFVYVFVCVCVWGGGERGGAGERGARMRGGRGYTRRAKKRHVTWVRERRRGSRWGCLDEGQGGIFQAGEMTSRRVACRVTWVMRL